MMLQIDINMDDVVIEGQKVLRPAWVSRSAWDELWTRFRDSEGRNHRVEYPRPDWYNKL